MGLLRLILFCFFLVLFPGCWVQSLLTDIRNSAPPPNNVTITPEALCGTQDFFQPGASALPYLLYYSTQNVDLTLTVQHGFPNKLIITDITDPNNQFLLQQYPNQSIAQSPSASLIAQGFWQVNTETVVSSSKSQEMDSITIFSPQNGPFFRVYKIQEQSVNPKYKAAMTTGQYFAIYYRSSSCVLEAPQFGTDQPTSLYTIVTWQDKCQKLNSPPSGGSSGGPQAGTISICPTFFLGAQRSGSLPLVNGLWLDDDGFLFLIIPKIQTNDDKGGVCIGASGCAVALSPIGTGWICGSNQICQAAMTLTNVAEGDWDFWFVKWDPVKSKLSGWEACGVPLLSPPANTSHMGASNTIVFNLTNNSQPANNLNAISYGYSIYNPYYIWETQHPNTPNPNNPNNPNNYQQPQPGFNVRTSLGTFTPKSLPVADPCSAPSAVNAISLPEGVWAVNP